jgi:hypothetical protein
LINITYNDLITAISMDWKLENPTIETALKYSQQDVELLTFD